MHAHSALGIAARFSLLAVAIASALPAAASPTFIWANVSGYSAAFALQPSAPANDYLAEEYKKANVQVYSLSQTPISEQTTATANLTYARATATQRNTLSFSSTSSGVFTHESRSVAKILGGSPYPAAFASAENALYNYAGGIPSGYRFFLSEDSFVKVTAINQGSGFWSAGELVIDSPIDGLIRRQYVFGGKTLLAPILLRAGYAVTLSLGTPYRSDEARADIYSPPLSTNKLKISFSIVPASGGVPEPASWALLIAGFGLVGMLARYRRRFAPTPVDGPVR